MSMQGNKKGDEPKGNEKAKEGGWFSYRNIFIGTGVAALTLVGYKAGYLKKVGDKVGDINVRDILGHPNTGPIGAAFLAPFTSVFLHNHFTMPRQVRLDAKRESAARVYAEMEIAFNDGMKCVHPDEKSQPNYPRAVEAFGKALNLLADQPLQVQEQFKDRLRNCLFNQALALFYLGIYIWQEVNALDNLNQLLNHDPKDREALNLRGLIYLKQGNFALAVKDFKQSLDIVRAQNDVYVCWLFARSQLQDRPSQSNGTKQSKEQKGGDVAHASKQGKPPGLQDEEKMQNPNFAYIKQHIQIPCNDKIFTTEILYIRAKVFLEEKQYPDAISSAETAFDCTAKNPGAFLEQLKILQALKDAYQGAYDSLKEGSITVPSLAKGKEGRVIRKENLPGLIKETGKKVGNLEAEMFLFNNQTGSSIARMNMVREVLGSNVIRAATPLEVIASYVSGELGDPEALPGTKLSL